jgi:glyoxylase-like metal-dependent hydrolase (beta-lactamase superfamily II)
VGRVADGEQRDDRAVVRQAVRVPAPITATRCGRPGLASPCASTWVAIRDGVKNARREIVVKTLKIGDVAITSLIERDGPWRTPEAMFPAYDPELGRKHLAELDPIVFDLASGRMVITYQTFLVRTPTLTVLIDTCTGEDKGYPAPYDFPKQPWLDNFRAAGLRFEDVTHVFCTHLHFDHCGWNTMLRNGRWTPTFPNAKYIFHKGEYAHWEAVTSRGPLPPGILTGSLPGNSWSYNCRPIVEAGQALLVDDAFQLDDNFTLVPTPGHSPHHCCVNIRSQGQQAIVTGDMMHHALQCGSRTGRPSSTPTPSKRRNRVGAFWGRSPTPAH